MHGLPAALVWSAQIKGEEGFKYERNLENPTLRSYTVIGLESNRQYTVNIRVCYELDKWGMWSNAINLMTLNVMRAKVPLSPLNRVLF